MSVNGLSTPLSALQVNQFRMDVAANNVANVNTDGFQASTVTTSDRAYINDIGQGTQVTGTYAPPRPGPMAIDTAAPNVTPAPLPNQAVPPAGGAASVDGMVELSNTDLVTEMTNMISAQRAYDANIGMSRTVDEANQTLLDLTT